MFLENVDLDSLPIVSIHGVNCVNLASPVQNSWPYNFDNIFKTEGSVSRPEMPQRACASIAVSPSGYFCSSSA